MNTIAQTDEQNAALSKIDRLYHSTTAVIEQITERVSITVKKETALITNKLFDNMSKAEIIEGILDNDTLSFNNLLNREDVKKALDDTAIILNQPLNDSVIDEACDIMDNIDLLYNIIHEDIIIFGIRPKTRIDIEEFETMVEVFIHL